MRTRKASTKMPAARARAIDLMIGSPAGTKAAKTENMMIAAAETTRAEEAKPASDGVPGRGAVDVGFAHAGDEEDLVVHGQAEEDAHDDDRQEADDRARRVDAQGARRSSPSWKTRTTVPKEAKTERRKPPVALSGTAIGAEDHHEQDDGESDDEDAEGQQRLAELVGDVDLDRGGAGDGGVEVVVVLDVSC
jgi:hypothetical protein